jgi:hypothetical protein
MLLDNLHHRLLIAALRPTDQSIHLFLRQRSDLVLR